MLKVELHTHTGDDPLDYIAHSTRQLIDRAAALGYQGLAVTLHNRYYDPARDRDYAAAKGIVLIPGIERAINGRHVLLLNFPRESERVVTFDALRDLRRRHAAGLVIAPHAFYPTSTAVGKFLDENADLFDAVEVNSMFSPLVDFNKGAVAWARAHRKPLVGNTDLHLLEQLGTTYTLVDAAPDPAAICAAIRAGRVEIRSTPLGLIRAGWIFTRMCAGGVVGRVRGMIGKTPSAAA